jgi:O-glycosyl hydrolase
LVVALVVVRWVRRICLASLIGLWTGCGALSALAAETIAVNTALRYQTISGWEAITRSWEIDKVNNNYDPSWLPHAAAVADRMVNELGINRIAMPLHSGWANPNDYWTKFVDRQLSYTQWGALSYQAIDPNSHQFAEFDFYADTVLMPMKQALEARGGKLYVNMIFGDGDKAPGTTYFFAHNPAAYAAFVQVYVDRLKTKYGVVLDAYTIINEPDNTKTWRGAEIGNALAAVRARLLAAGYPDVKLIAPSVASPGNALPYLTAIAGVPGALAALDTVSYHRYGSADIAAIQAWAAQRGKETVMSELFTANVDTVLDDLLVGQVSSWQKWSVAGKKGGSLNGYYVADLSNPAAPVFSFAPNVAPMALVFRYARLGAVRVDAQSATMRTVAFVNPDGSNVVVVKRPVEAGSGPVTISGVKQGTYGVRSIAAGSTQASNQPDVTAAANGTLTVNLAAGYTAIYGKGQTSALPSSTITLVEYRHADWDHYFLTGDPDEITKLDSGTLPGWVRTGDHFKAYDSGAAFGSSVCRFFSTSFAPRSSHFYTPSVTECGIVGNSSAWSLEGVVFDLPIPDPEGTCAAGTHPVYRMYNNGQGGAPNHRYTSNPDVRSQMLARGWILEGNGPDGSIMCAPE